jgi:FYVE/RhoGEF/PH domain-containing protein 5/6
MSSRHTLDNSTTYNINIIDFIENRLTEENLDNLFNTDKLDVKEGVLVGRSHIVFVDLYTTEENFIRNLLICLLVYMKPIESWLTQIKNPQKENFISIIRDIKSIFYVNFVLMINLRNRLKEWSPTQKIGDIMLLMSQYLKVYKLYAEHYHYVIDSIDYFQNTISDANFKKCLNNGLKHPLTDNNSLHDMLILPIQRIPRYVSILKNYLKYTEKDHVDYKDLEAAMVEFDKLAKGIEEVIDNSKSRNRCLEIQSEIDVTFGEGSLPITTIIEAHRLLIKEGILKVQFHNSIRERRFFLFNDILITTSLNSFKFKPMRAYWNRNLVIDTFPTNDTAFKIYHWGESFTAFSSNRAEKQDWLNAFDQVRIRPSTPSNLLTLAPVWVPDTNASQCMRCNEPFNVIIRKHHCRKCGYVVCDSCSSHKAIVHSVDRKNKVRVCDTCLHSIPQQKIPVP